jgi:rubrerythrin
VGHRWRESEATHLLRELEGDRDKMWSSEHPGGDGSSALLAKSSVGTYFDGREQIQMKLKGVVMGFANIDEILDYAISKEEEAALLYTDLAERMERPGMREAFLEFADEEEGHKRHLESIKVGDLPALTIRQVQDLGIVKRLVEPEPTANMTYAEALIVVIKAEQAAHELYTGLAEATDDPNLAAVFIALASEEAKHKHYFEVEYDEVVLEGV